MTATSVSRARQLAAWLVHLYTISGGLVATWGFIEALDGDIRIGFLLIILSRLIDATDGLLARAVDVRTALPNFNGSNVDNLIDIYTYMWIPVVLMWSENVLPSNLWLAAPIMGTLYVYGQENMKSDDYFFVGFPALWGTVLIYMVYLEPSSLVAVLCVLIPSILSFIPFKYLYFTQNRFLRIPGYILSGLWVLLWLYILLNPPVDTTLVWLSLFYPVFYMAGSLLATYKFRVVSFLA